MKKKLIWMLFVYMCGCAAPVCADSHTPIQIGQLPTKAQSLITTYFKGHKVAMAKMENGLFYKSYDVIFTNGEKLEFNRSGEWRELRCKAHGVPESLIPDAIQRYVKENYPESWIIEIERDSDGYEVKLSNHWELKFDNRFRITDIDN